jgi:membrane-bound ClpP family serine protease
MELDKFIEWTGKLDKKKKGKKEETERLQKFFERFHLVNRNYLNKEAFEKAKESIPSIAESVANTVRYLEAEITRLRNKRAKLPFENVELGEMQKIQDRNGHLLKEYLSEEKEAQS